MIDSLAQKEQILRMVNAFGSCVMDERIMRTAFPQPDNLQILNLALALSGNRPAESSMELLEVFCKQNELMWTRDLATPTITFRKR